MRSFIRVGAGPALAMFLSACAGMQGVDPSKPSSVDLLVKQFETVTFHDEYDQKREIDRVRKWVRPVNIALIGPLAERYRGAVERHARALSPLAGLPITVQPARNADTNIEIHFVRWDDMEKTAAPHAPNPKWLKTIIDESTCMFIFKRNARYEIVWAMIVVSTDEPVRNTENCLLEEMTQALGLPNDSELSYASVFSQRIVAPALTPDDQLVVRALYDARLKPGMPKREAIAAARGILSELRTKFLAQGPAALHQPVAR